LSEGTKLYLYLRGEKIEIMEQGKCYMCGDSLILSGAFGMCVSCSAECAEKDQVNYIVKFGNNSELFETESEAQEFLNQLHNAKIEKLF